jgi:hypothetical protein
MIVKDEIWVLSVASIFILVLLLSLLFYLVIRKAYENSRRKQIDQMKETMNPLLFTYLVEGEISRWLQPDTDLKKQALEELLTHYSDILEGEGEKRYLTNLAHQHLTEYYRKSLKSFRWSRRMNALYHIEDFNMNQMLVDIETIVIKGKSSKEELVLSLRILASFQALNLSTLLLKREIELTENDYRTILFRMDSTQFEPFISEYNHFPEALKYALIEVISLKKEVAYVWFLEKIFATNVGEGRLRALKAISSIGYVSDIQSYYPLFESSVWQERMMVTKLCGGLKDRNSLVNLRKMLADSSWWVRFQAGQAIMMFSDGIDILNNLYQTTEDPFVRDMALEWMDKGAS